MNIEELSKILNGRKYREEMNGLDEEQLRKDGIVIVFGASDDLTEFRGSIEDEIGCYEGNIFSLNEDGIIGNECNNDECPYHIKMIDEAIFKIEAIWDYEGYSWYYKTNIKSLNFDTFEDERKYCRGLLFYLKDLKSNG